MFHCEGLGACLDIEMSVPFVRSAERVPLTMRRALSGAGLGGPRPCSSARSPGTIVT